MVPTVRGAIGTPLHSVCAMEGTKLVVLPPNQGVAVGRPKKPTAIKQKDHFWAGFGCETPWQRLCEPCELLFKRPGLGAVVGILVGNYFQSMSKSCGVSKKPNITYRLHFS